MDDNFVFDEDEDEELQNEEKFDEFAEFFDQEKAAEGGGKIPKIYLTTNERPKG